MNNQFLLSVCFALFHLSLPLHAGSQPDYDRERRIAEQIVPGIFDGEAVWLEANHREFLAIHIPTENSRGALVLLHGRDVSPEEQNLIGPLRVGLSEQGWTTLALQLPVLEKGKTYYDYLPVMRYSHQRIESAIAFLKSRGEKRIILVSHSCGAHMTNDWLNNVGAEGIDGYVAIGLGATDIGQWLKTPFPIANINVPVLDISGSEEFPRPLAMIPDRVEMLKLNGHPDSIQISVEGANHYFTDYGDIATEVIGSWLDSVTFNH